MSFTSKIRTLQPNTLTLLGLVIIGSILRFYDFFNLPMTHDELSAIYRLKFDTFHELIEKGVKIEGHPAGVQVFLYYWTKLVGHTDYLIKLPFLLLGVGSIALSYLLAKKWFNITTAIIVTTFITSLQFTITYSQIARPYISGLFFCLLMVLFWSKYLFDEQPKRKKIVALIGFVLSAAVCCYNHHFSALFAFIVGITGFFFLKKNTVIVYCISLISIFILYVPHLDIFFHQLGYKGLDWVSEPKNSFIIDHLKYVFHYNYLVYIFVIVLFMVGIFLKRKNILSFNKFQIISASWFLIPIIIGMLYSNYRQPILQDSMLIFSFPFLLLFLFSFYKSLSVRFNLVLVVLILLFNVSTLVWTRQHYAIFYKQPFKEYAVLTQKFITQHDAKKTAIFFNDSPQYIDYYFSKYNPEINYISMFNAELNPVEFKNQLNSTQSDYIITGNIPLEYLSIIKEHYPFLILKDFGFTYEYYIFSKTKISHKPIKDVIYSKKLNSTHGSIDSLTSAIEWGPTFETSLTKVIQSRHDFIEVGIDFQSLDSSDCNGLLVSEILKNNAVVDWRSSSIQIFYDSTKTHIWQRAYLAYRLSDIIKESDDLSDYNLKIFYWNKNKESILLKNFAIQMREGNKKVYSLFEDME